MKIYVLGSSNTIFIHVYINLFMIEGYDVYFIDSSSSCINIDGLCSSKIFSHNVSMANKKTKITNLIKNIISKFDLESIPIFTKIIEMSKFKKSVYNDYELECFVTRNEPDVIFCFWSTSIRNEFFQIKNILEKNKIKTKYILDVPTYPIRGKFKVDDSNPLIDIDKDYFNLFDKLILPSKFANSYFRRNGFISDKCESVISTCNFPSLSYANESSGKSINGLIFLGHVNFSNRAQDNVSEALAELTKLGIDIYIQESNENKRYISLVNKKGNGKIFEFKPFSNSEILSGNLSEYISRFSGVLCIYNETKSTRTELTYPTRFALALLSIKPIYLMKGIYTSLEEVYNEEQGVFFYKNNKELTNLMKLNHDKIFDRSDLHVMNIKDFL